MTDTPEPTDISALEAYVGKPGVYIEQGLFIYGKLRGCRTHDHGLIELDLDFDDGASLSVSAMYVELADGAAQASGYVSWAWIYDPETIARIEARVAERRAESADPVDPYRVARGVLEPNYEAFHARLRERAERNDQQALGSLAEAAD